MATTTILWLWLWLWLWLAQAAPAASDLSHYTMEPMGWVFMIASNGLVVALTAFCYYRVLAKPSATKRMHAPLDIDTQDRGT